MLGFIDQDTGREETEEMGEGPETQPSSIRGETEPLHKTQADTTLLLLQQQQVWKKVIPWPLFLPVDVASKIWDSEVLCYSLALSPSCTHMFLSDNQPIRWKEFSTAEQGWHPCGH